MGESATRQRVKFTTGSRLAARGVQRFTPERFTRVWPSATFEDSKAGRRLAAELKSKTDALEAAEKSLAAANQKKQDEEAKAKAREEMMKRKRAEAEAKIAAEMAAWDAQN